MAGARPRSRVMICDENAAHTGRCTPEDADYVAPALRFSLDMVFE
jgi:hypothetical protein